MEEALKLRLQIKLEVTALCQLTPTVFEENRTLTEMVIQKNKSSMQSMEKLNEQH